MRNKLGWYVAIVALLVVAAGCASPVPPRPSTRLTPGPSSAPEPSTQPIPTQASIPSAAAVFTSEAIVDGWNDSWSARCVGVDGATCIGVGGVAINNLGRNRPSGLLTVESRSTCPTVPSWADPSQCWQIYAPVGAETVCMVVAKGYDGHFGQVAGDVPVKATLPGTSRGCP